MNKVITTIVCVLLGVASGFAQEEFKQSLSGINKIELETNTMVNVKIGTSNEIIFENGATCNNCDHDNHYDYNEHEYENDQDDEEERSKGLKAVYAGGVDNTGFGMQMDKDGDVMRLTDLKSFTQRRGFTITIPANIDLKLDCGSLGGARVEDFSKELEVKTSVGSIELVNVTGPITAHSSVGAIDVKFREVNQSSPISISSSTSPVDVSLPSNTKANIEMRSTMGSVYSNFDLEVPREDGLKAVGGQRKIKGELNGGGVNISLRSSTGNIYLRKN